jgi:hypothetical protein
MKQQLLNRILQYQQLQDVLFYAVKRSELHGYVGNVYAFCRTINIVFKIDVYIDERFERHFPELWSLRPEQRFERDYWFSLDTSGINERIALLTKAIQLTEEKLNTFNSLKTN